MGASKDYNDEMHARSATASNRVRATALALLIAILNFAADSFAQSKPTALPSAPATQPDESLADHPGVSAIDWPTDRVGGKLFFIYANIKSTYTVGVPREFVVYIPHTTITLRKQLAWGFGAQQDSIRQFRLPGNKQALAILDRSIFSSLVVIYSVNADEAAGKHKFTVSTRDGSLEAWILRHPVPADLLHDDGDTRPDFR